MSRGTTKRMRLLLFAALCAGGPSHSRAQIAGSLAPPLTNEPLNAPIITLNPDAALKRTYNSDPTGAGVLRQTFTPSVNPVAFSSVFSADATSPQSAPAAGRTGLNGLDAERYRELVSDSENGESVDESDSAGIGRRQARQSSDADSAWGERNEPNSGYSSAWGSSSGFGSQWDTQSTPLAGLGRNRNSLASNDEFSRPAFGASASQGLSSPSEPLETPSASVHGLSTRTRRTSAGGGRVRAAATNDSTSATGLATDAFSSSQDTESVERLSSPAGRASAPGDAAAPETIERVLAFSPRSYAGYAFGASPFQSLDTDMTFLKPNIFNVGPAPIQFSSAGSAHTSRRSRTLSGNGAEGVLTSGAGVAAGSLSHRDALDSASVNRRKRNPYLTTAPQRR